VAHLKNSVTTCRYRDGVVGMHVYRAVVKLIGGLLIAKTRWTETVRTAVLVRRRHGNTATPRASVAKARPASCSPTARQCFGRERGED
jgi:hypothetical protein